MFLYCIILTYFIYNSIYNIPHTFNVQEMHKRIRILSTANRLSVFDWENFKQNIDYLI